MVHDKLQHTEKISQEKVRSDEESHDGIQAHAGLQEPADETWG